MAVTVAKADIPTFPAAEIEQQLRELMVEEAQVQETLRGAGGGGGRITSGGSSRAEPDIDSLVAVEALTVIEPFVPFDLPESLIRPGGYTSVDDFINDLLPRVHNRWRRHYEPTFRTSVSDLSYFCVLLEVLYNLLTMRGDCHARPSPVP